MILSRLKRAAISRLRRAMLGGSELQLYRSPFGAVVCYPARSQIGYALHRDDFENAELKFVQASLAPGDAFIDIGANAGIFSLLGASCVGENGVVIAYEPGISENTVLKTNLVLNQATNVIVHRLGVSDSIGPADFIVSADGAMNSLKRTRHPDQHAIARLTIDTTTLLAILAQYAELRVKLIKIDTEGAERQIILPALSELLRRRIRVLFESQDSNNRAFNYTAKEFLEEIAAGGGTVKQLLSNGEVAPLPANGQGIGDRIYNFALVCSDSDC